MKISNALMATGLGCILALSGTMAVEAQSVGGFYKNKTVTMYIGYPSGGGYDAFGRTVARHMGNHVPGNPRFTPKNRPGAGTIKLANEVFNTLPQDGTFLAMIDRGIAMEALFGSKQVRFKPTKFNWIGSVNNEVSTCVTWHTKGVNSLKQFLSRKLVMGGTGPGTGPDMMVKVLNNVIGANLNLVTGYPGGNNINLAIERGEVDGRCGWSWSSISATRPDWVKNGKINILIQMSTSKHPELTKKGVPWIMDMGKTDRDRQILTLLFAREAMGRPIVVGPGVPKARVKALRASFIATTKDPKFLADLKKQRLESAPLTGTEVQSLVARIMNTKPDVVEASREATQKTGKMYIKKVKVKMAKHSGPVTKVKRGGRRVWIKYKGKEVKTKISGSKTKVTINGKKTKRKNIKVGMTCTFIYPGSGSRAKNVDCKS
jgi:tripartite-type tricarboxylate transporter receptor subunit TctC